MKTINKFFEILAFLFIGLASSEIKADNANGAFVDTKTPNHMVTEGDVKQIAHYVDIDGIVAGKWYTLNSGFIFKMDNPSLFKKTTLSILSEVKGTQVTSIRKEFDSIQILDWDDNISTKTWNYNMNGGKLGYSDNYSGGPGVRVVMYHGQPVLKVGKPCFNPNRPKANHANRLDQGLKNNNTTAITTGSNTPCFEWYEYDSITRVFFAPKEGSAGYESYAYNRRNYVPWGDYTGYYGFDQQYMQGSGQQTNSNNNGGGGKDCKCTCDPFPNATLKNSYSIHVKRLVPCGQQGEKTVCLTLVEEPKKQNGRFFAWLGRVLRVSVGVNNYYAQTGTPGQQGGFQSVTPGGQSGGFQSITPGRQGRGIIVTPGSQGGFTPVTPGRRLGK